MAEAKGRQRAQAGERRKTVTRTKAAKMRGKGRDGTEMGEGRLSGVRTEWANERRANGQ